MINNKAESLIVWQKWFDPFGEDEETHSLEEEDIDMSMYQQKPVKAISTPMGIIPCTENTASGKIFNFWIGHTNFNITSIIAKTIEEIDGVETLDIFTRYRFRVGIGKAFNESKVKEDINYTVYNLCSYGDENIRKSDR